MIWVRFGLGATSSINGKSPRVLPAQITLKSPKTHNKDSQAGKWTLLLHFSAYSGHRIISHTFFLCPPLALATCGVRGKGGRQGKGVGEEGGLTLQTPINITSATCGSTSRTVFCISSNKIGFILKNVSGIEVRGYFMAVTLIFKEEHQFFHTVHLFLSYKQQHLPGPSFHSSLFSWTLSLRYWPVKPHKQKQLYVSR